MDLIEWILYAGKVYVKTIFWFVVIIFLIGILFAW